MLMWAWFDIYLKEMVIDDFFSSLQSSSFTKEAIKHKVMTKPFIRPSIFLTAYYMKKIILK